MFISYVPNLNEKGVRATNYIYKGYFCNQISQMSV